MTEFTAVVTTGIYCRAGCPATPLRRNMRPFSYAAAAEAAGFRPCLRCRPDREPEPAWVDAPELVCRSLRSIADGALDEANEDTLAASVGVSARHLRRLFETHVGATPADVARSRRAHFARRLLDETDLSIARVGDAAGFNSVRQMNRVMRDVFHFTPQELRAKRRMPDRCVADGGLETRIPYRPPFAWDALLAYLAPRAIPGVEAVDLDAGVYRRTVELGGAPGVIEVWNEPAHDSLRVRSHLPEIEGLVHLIAAVRRAFDLESEPAVVDRALARDPLLRPLVRAQPGMRLAGTTDPLEIGVRAVLGQQISVASATRLAGRLVTRYGRPVPGIDALGLTHVFPTAATLARADLRVVGVTGARATAINAFAAARAAGELSLERAAPAAETFARLRGLPGFGEWTASYVLMRACGESDVFPAADLGLRRALDVPDVRSAAARAEAFSPWRSYAAMYLWTASPEGAANAG
jgi:AraC family transcriptional regulator of adaptative response / DNA-3-methyladenine glycosylase II